MQIKDSIVAREAMMTSIIKHFGEVAPMVEHNVFSWMNFLSEDYDGGMWDYHELSNGGFESIAKRMIKYLLFARSHEIWQREIL